MIKRELKVTVNPDLVAPCGMNCALCSGYLALKNNSKSMGIKIPYCSGCRPRNKKCAFLKKRCLKLSTGEVAFCFECNSFPCDHLRAIDSRYKSHYRMSMIENLIFIKESGVAKFLEKQKEIWKCPKCGEMICCHNGICFSCSLDELINKKEKYRWKDERKFKSG